MMILAWLSHPADLDMLKTLDQIYQLKKGFDELKKSAVAFKVAWRQKQGEKITFYLDFDC